MITNPTDSPTAATPGQRRRTRRRVIVAGVLGSAALAGGAGFASAAATPEEIVETGYATVVDGSGSLCPDGGDGAGAGAGTDGGL